MAHESNAAGKVGAANPNLTTPDFKARGMSDSQAAEANAAAERARREQSGSKS